MLSRAPLTPPVGRVDAQWMTAKKDWQELKRKHKTTQRSAKENSESMRSTDEGENAPEGTYDKNMDAMRCILYLHGGKITARPTLMVSTAT